jgi:hypothetical protein
LVDHSSVRRLPVTSTRTINGWLVHTAAIAVVVVFAQRARGQDEIGDVEEANVPIAARVRPEIDEQEFLRRLLGGPASMERVQDILEVRLQAQLEVVEREYNLTPDQSQKLSLAGQGDIKHFRDRVDEARRRFLAGARDRNQLFALLRQPNPFQIALAGGIFGEGSLFAKTFARVVSRQQVEGAARIRLAGEKAWYRSAIAETVDKLSRSLSLTPDQRRRFESLLAEHTAPPKKSGDSGVAYVMFQAARLPRFELEPIFDDDQRRLLWRLLESYENIEEFLKDDGFLFEPPPLTPHSHRTPKNRSNVTSRRDKTVQDERPTLEKVAHS